MNEGVSEWELSASKTGLSLYISYRQSVHLSPYLLKAISWVKKKKKRRYVRFIHLPSFYLAPTI